MIRPFKPSDIGPVCRLHQKAFGAQPHVPIEALEDQFDEVFFQNPWVVQEQASMVYEARDGRITGFFGVLPRPMTFDGEPIRAVMGTQLMVDPDRSGPMEAHRMVRTLFSTGYDLVITDGATPDVVRLWSSHGADRLWLQSLKWTRSVRPAKHLLKMVADRRSSLRPLTLAARPVAAALDAAFASVRPNHFRRAMDHLDSRPLDSDGYRQLLECRPRRRLKPVYSDAYLDWTFRSLQQKRRHGDLVARRLRRENGDVAGWYLYYSQAGGVAEVVDVGGRPPFMEDVLNHLFRSAWRRGAVAVRGTFQPELGVSLNELHARYRTGAPWVAAYSPRPEILAALHSGDAALTRMDMEFPLRFLGG